MWRWYPRAPPPAFLPSRGVSWWCGPSLQLRATSSADTRSCHRKLAPRQACHAVHPRGQFSPSSSPPQARSSRCTGRWRNSVVSSAWNGWLRSERVGPRCQLCWRAMLGEWPVRWIGCDADAPLVVVLRPPSYSFAVSAEQFCSVPGAWQVVVRWLLGGEVREMLFLGQHALVALQLAPRASPLVSSRRHLARSPCHGLCSVPWLSPSSSKSIMQTSEVWCLYLWGISQRQVSRKQIAIKKWRTKNTRVHPNKLPIIQKHNISNRIHLIWLENVKKGRDEAQMASTARPKWTGDPVSCDNRNTRVEPSSQKISAVGTKVSLPLVEECIRTGPNINVSLSRQRGVIRPRAYAANACRFSASQWKPYPSLHSINFKLWMSFCQTFRCS